MTSSSHLKMVSVIIPARDEASSIGSLIPKVKQSLSGYPYEIIVVRDEEYLNWRYVHIPDVNYVIYIAEKGGQILGYTILRCADQKGLKIGYIFELVVPLEQEELAQSLILKATEFFKEEKADLILYAVIGNKTYYGILRKSGFIYSRLISKRAPFIARVNTPKISEAFLRDPRHWFVQIGDSDLI